MFNSDSHDFEGIIDEILEDTKSRGNITKIHEKNLKDIILSRNRSHSTISGAIILKYASPEGRNSIINDIGRRMSYWLSSSSSNKHSDEISSNDETKTAETTKKDETVIWFNHSSRKNEME